jgi:hypothetical protein
LDGRRRSIGRRDAPIELSASSKSLRYREWSAAESCLDATVKTAHPAPRASQSRKQRATI